MQETNPKGLLKVMSSLLTVGGEKKYLLGLGSVCQARDEGGR